MSAFRPSAREAFGGLSIALFLLLAGACSRLELDDPGGGGPPPPPPAPLPGEHATVSLISAVGAPGSLRADWRVSPAAEGEVEIALFVGESLAGLYDQPPLALALEEGRVIVAGLDDGNLVWVGLGLRAAGSADDYSPSGPALRARPGAPVYVDPSGDPAGGDGESPATAFGDLAIGLLTAFVDGGANVWVAGGDLPPSSLPVFGGVHVFGGFDPSFELAARDPLVHPTRLRGAAGQPVFAIEDAAGAAVIDGFTIDGEDVATAGVESAQEIGVELRQLEIERCQRGVKLRLSPAAERTAATVTAVHASASAIEGLLVDGPFDVQLEASRFDLNHDEGVAMSLYAAPGASASARIRASLFDRNGAEGLDVQLEPFPGAVAGEAAYDVRVADCDFELNQLDGAKIDVESEALPGWTTRAEVRGVRARANRLAGLHLDLDSTSTAFVHRLAASANAGPGLHVTSESAPGTATLSCSAIYANQQGGVVAELGEVGVVASHCIFSGNFGTAFASSTVPGIAVSSVADLSDGYSPNVLAHACASSGDGEVTPFLRSARRYARIVAGSGASWTLSAALGASPGDVVEIDDDGVERTVLSAAGTSISLDPAPLGIVLPAVIGLFEGAGGVGEDWRLAPASIAVGAGMSAPSAPAVDAGIFSGPFGGVPGREDAPPRRLFRLATTEPAWTAALAARDLVLGFEEGAPDPGSVPAAVFLVTASGASIAISPFVSDALLVVPAPAGGWNAGTVLEIVPPLASTGGDPIAAPMALPITP